MFFPRPHVILPRVAPAAGNRWNAADKDASIVLSGSPLLTAAATSSGGWNSARAVDSASSGKLFWELTFNTSPGSDAFIVGFANSTFNLSNAIPGNDNDSFSYDPGSGFIRLNGHNGGVQAATIGNTAAIAVDFTAKLFWLAVISAGPTIGNWNDDAAQNPSTGAGGISFSTMNAGPYFALAGMILTSGTNLTANFGQSPYVIVSSGGSVPTGFGNWP